MSEINQRETEGNRNIQQRKKDLRKRKIVSTGNKYIKSAQKLEEAGINLRVRSYFSM